MSEPTAEHSPTINRVDSTSSAVDSVATDRWLRRLKQLVALTLAVVTAIAALAATVLGRQSAYKTGCQCNVTHP